MNLCCHRLFSARCLRSIVPADYDALETLFKGAVKEKQPFQRLVVSKEKLLEMFAVRLHLLSRVADHSLTSPDCNSITSTKSISSTRRSPMAPLQPYIDVDR